MVVSAAVQIVLQRNGVDPDPLGLSLDVDRIIESYTDKEKLLHIESQVWVAHCIGMITRTPSSPLSLRVDVLLSVDPFC